MVGTKLGRWHHPTCKNPSIRVICGLPYCCQCSEFPIEADENSRSHETPQDTQSAARHTPRSLLRISWPTSVNYDTESSSTDVGPKLTNEDPVKDTQGIGGSPTCANSSYQYDDLSSLNEIRILALSSGKNAEPLHGDLSNHQLRYFAAYEALSYTWASFDNDEHRGDRSKSETIYLGPYWDPFRITRNCEKALRSLRYSDRCRNIWVDSICINQDNGEERNHQVRLMQEIFENALTVIVYLGCSSADSDLALQALRGTSSAQVEASTVS